MSVTNQIRAIDEKLEYYRGRWRESSPAYRKLIEIQAKRLKDEKARLVLKLEDAALQGLFKRD